MATLFSATKRYDARVLQQEVGAARRLLDFGQGTFGHSISLPAAVDLAEAYRDHRNNVPYADALGRCRTLAEILREFRAEKASFRLLRREAGTAYSLHDDHDLPGNVVRMQLPIATNNSAMLLVQKDEIELEPLARRVAEFGADDAETAFDYSRAANVFGEWFDFFYLEPGYFHAFDTNQIHTLVNAGSTDRITLCMDLVRNEWLERWMAANLTRAVAARPVDNLPEGRWNWTALRHGLLTHPRISLT